jgi:hypothetical protein
MIKLLSLGYQKINMCQNFCMLYHLKNTESTEFKTYGRARCKPEVVVERLLLHIENLDTSQSHLDCKGYLCL